MAVLTEPANSTAETLKPNYVRRSKSITRVVLPTIDHRSFAVSAALHLLLRVATLLAPFLLAFTVNEADSGPTTVAAGVLLLMMAAASAAIASALGQALLLSVVRVKSADRLTRDVVTRLFDLDYDFFRHRSTADVMLRLRSLVTLREFVTATALSVIIDGTLSVLLAAILFAISPVLALTALAIGALEGVIGISAQPALRRRSAVATQQELEANRLLLQFVAGIVTIKSLSLTKYAVSHWESKFAAEVDGLAEKTVAFALVNAIQSSIHSIAPLALLGVVFHQISSGRLEVTSAVAGYGMGLVILQPVHSLCALVSALPQIWPHALRIVDVYDHHSAAGTETATTATPSGTASGEGAICLSVAAVRYRPGRFSAEILQGASLEIHQGECVAVIGKSGAGKSTLGQIIIGLMEPTDGAVRYIAESDAGWVQCQNPFTSGHGAVVPQSTKLFAGTIEENILVGRAKDSPCLEAAVTMAQLAEDINAMPLGLATPVGDNESLISGGQRQRIALARALYRKPSWLLLDEATSELDPDTEAAVLKELRALDAGVIFISHSPRVQMWSDRVVEVKDGLVQASPSSSQHL